MADSGYRVLVVEDEEMVRGLLVAALQVKGHRVETCCDGAEALQRLEKNRFDVVITDFRMPRMTGIELIKTLRAQPKRIPIVLMSSNSLEEMAVNLRDLAGVEYLRKPFGLVDLYGSLKRAVNGRRE